MSNSVYALILNQWHNCHHAWLPDGDFVSHLSLKECDVHVSEKDRRSPSGNPACNYNNQ